jgi:hypothetical protein
MELPQNIHRKFCSSFDAIGRSSYPSGRVPSDVVSIFSDAYTNISSTKNTLVMPLLQILQLPETILQD